MRFVSADEVYRICRSTALVDALCEAHRGERPLCERSLIQHEVNGELQSYVNISAWLPGEAFATKVITILPGNPSRDQDLPAIQALVPLFDGKTGAPRAVLDGTSLTYVKTAADSALGARLLAKPQPESLALVGTGGLAPHVVRAHLMAHPSITRVRVWGRRRQAADAVAADLTGLPADVEVAGELESAVRSADIVTCVTASTTPLVRGKWLRPGAHLDLIGSFTPDMRECDDEAIRRARLFVDSPWGAIEEAGDICDPLARGVISRDDIEADLFDLCSGKFQLDRAADDVTLFKNGGGAHLDLFAAQFITEVCESGS